MGQYHKQKVSAKCYKRINDRKEGVARELKVSQIKRKYACYVLN